MKKHFNVAVNNLYDARLLNPHSLVSYGSLSTMLVWSVFFHLPKCLLLLLYMHISYISQDSVKVHWETKVWQNCSEFVIRVLSTKLYLRTGEEQQLYQYLLKSGKPPNQPGSYRSISLTSCTVIFSLGWIRGRQLICKDIYSSIHITFCINFYPRKMIALTISDRGVIFSH